MINSYIIRLKSVSKGTVNDVNKSVSLFLKKGLEEFSVRNSGVFSVSSFLNKRRFKLDIEENQNYYFVLTTYNKDLFGSLNAILFKHKITKSHICIEEVIFQVTDIIIDSNKNSYVNSLDIVKLKSNYTGTKDIGIENKTEYEDSIHRINVTTPTVFKVGSNFINDIEVSLIFKNLISKFNKYTDYNIEKIDKSELDKIELKLENIKLKEIKLNRTQAIGFTGEIEIDTNNCSKDTREKINLLLNFSKFCNFGYDTKNEYIFI